MAMVIAIFGVKKPAPGLALFFTVQGGPRYSTKRRAHIKRLGTLEVPALHFYILVRILRRVVTSSMVCQILFPLEKTR